MQTVISILLVISLFAGLELAFAKVTDRSPSVKAYRGTPKLAFGTGDSDGCLDPADAVDFASRDTNRIVGNISMALIRKSPYVDVLEGGTLENVSENVRSIIQERAVLNQSLTNPAFQADISMCGVVGEAAETGTTEYNFSLGTNRGMGPLVCIKQTRTAFQGTYSAVEDAIRKQIVNLISADTRATLVNRSGCKLVVHSGKTFEQMFSGDSQQVDTAFTTDVGLPNARLNFKLLKQLSVFMREYLLVDTFDAEPENVMKLIGDIEILDFLRDDANIRDDHRYLAAGSYKVGEKTLTRYAWEGPYRGWAFGVDSQPLRFSVLDGNGQPVFIEPEIAVNSTKGVASRVNPAWARARFGIAVAMGSGSFRKLTPKQPTGEGTFKFPAQTFMGELKFKVIEDNCLNAWGDFGRHYYQISRAYKPERPHAVCAIAYKRAAVDFDLTSVDDYSGYSASDSL